MRKAVFFGTAVLIVSAMMTVSAQAGGPGEWDGSCEGYGTENPFRNVCEANATLANADEDLGYIGSCEGGGRCDDSVENKLSSAQAKVMAGKYVDAVENVCTIISDANTWADTSKKKKLTQEGRDALVGAAATLAASIIPGATCY